MPVRDIERELESLSALRHTESSALRTGALRKALGDKVNVIVARAAKIAGELHERELIPDLCASFERLMRDPLKTDPKCWGKEAIAKALKDLEHTDSAIFRTGSKHVQYEPVWGGEEDTASTLRSTSVLALLACTDLTREDKLWSVVPLLTERSPSLRKDAAVALQDVGGREAALLLRIKARMGDNDSTVTGQVFESLLNVEGESAVPFVSEFLQCPNPELSSESALALGASRLPAAVAALKHAFSRKHMPLDVELLCRALGISRNADAIGFLLDLVRRGRLHEATVALESLALYRDSQDISTKVSAVIADRSEPELQRSFQKLFTNPASGA
jgi:hypothetical protein